ncbi:MAG: ATPase [Natronomonas sp.]
MKLLVAGATEVDAGKTTFSMGLVDRLGVPGFKPRAGNDYWFDHDDYLRAVGAGRLFGKDARRLAVASPGDVTPESINPVHRLWLPTPGSGTGLLGREGRDFLVDRVTVDGTHQFVDNGTVDLPPMVRERLPLDRAITVDSRSAFDEVMSDRHVRALSASADDISGREDAVVESYADIARPLQSFVPEAVAVVEPRRCRIYDGERYAKSCEVSGSSAHEGRLEKRVDRVLELLEPTDRVALPALAKRERDDPAIVADAYEDAYDALLAVGG